MGARETGLSHRGVHEGARGGVECSAPGWREQTCAGATLLAAELNQRVLVTGGSGFVASALLLSTSAGIGFVAASRRSVRMEGVEWRTSPDLGPSAEWRPLLEGVDCVVHLAGRAHLPPGAEASPYFVENCDGSLKLARDARAAGIKRFVYLSTAKVLGDESSAAPLAEDALARPGDPYAASKLAAEQALATVGGPMAVTILRPPLVYGPGVKANFLALLSAVARGTPLPLASIRNRRSLIGVDNLASAILACLKPDASSGGTYNVTDGTPVSTPDLVRALAAALQRPAQLFAFPPRLLEVGGALLGRVETVKRLTRSFEIDDRAIRRELGWEAPNAFDEGIAATARWYQGLP